MHIDGPWTIIGDFNAILHPTEQVGGCLRPNWGRINIFRNCLNDCGMSDLGFVARLSLGRIGNLGRVLFANA